MIETWGFCEDISLMMRIMMRMKSRRSRATRRGMMTIINHTFSKSQDQVMMMRRMRRSRTTMKRTRRTPRRRKVIISKL